MNDWFEIVGLVLFSLLVWFGLGWLIAQLDTPASGEREAPASRVAPTGTGSAQGPRSYRDAYTDHREHGDEDPPLYTPRPPTIEELQRALNERTSDGIPVEPPHGLPPGHKPIFDKCRGLARPKRVKLDRKRDGIRLGDEASAALLKDIFGDHPPA